MQHMCGSQMEMSDAPRNLIQTSPDIPLSSVKVEASRDSDLRASPPHLSTKSSGKGVDLLAGGKFTVVSTLKLLSPSAISRSKSNVHCSSSTVLSPPLSSVSETTLKFAASPLICSNAKFEPSNLIVAPVMSSVTSTVKTTATNKPKSPSELASSSKTSKLKENEKLNEHKHLNATVKNIQSLQPTSKSAVAPKFEVTPVTNTLKSSPALKSDSVERHGSKAVQPVSRMYFVPRTQISSTERTLQPPPLPCQLKQVCTTVQSSKTTPSKTEPSSSQKFTSMAQETVQSPLSLLGGPSVSSKIHIVPFSKLYTQSTARLESLSRLKPADTAIVKTVQSLSSVASVSPQFRKCTETSRSRCTESSSLTPLPCDRSTVDSKKTEVVSTSKCLSPLANVKHNQLKPSLSKNVYSANRTTQSRILLSKPPQLETKGVTFSHALSSLAIPDNIQTTCVVVNSMSNISTLSPQRLTTSKQNIIENKGTNVKMLSESSPPQLNSSVPNIQTTGENMLSEVSVLSNSSDSSVFTIVASPPTSAFNESRHSPTALYSQPGLSSKPAINTQKSDGMPTLASVMKSPVSWQLLWHDSNVQEMVRSSSLETKLQQIQPDDCGSHVQVNNHMRTLLQNTVYNLIQERSSNNFWSQRDPYCSLCVVFTASGDPLSKAVLLPVPTVRPASSTVWLPSGVFLVPTKRPEMNVRLHNHAKGSTLVTCQDCHVCVHAACYGVTLLPKVLEQWRCDKCRAAAPHVECALCGRQGGAVKRTTDGGWAHLLCALLVPGIWFRDTLYKEPINMLSMKQAHCNRECVYCQLMVGGTVSCSDPMCGITFHASCALLNGASFNIDCSGSAYQIVVMCLIHNYNKRQQRQIKTGQKVYARHSNGRICEGTVTHVSNSLSYTVSFGDTSFCDDVDPQRIMNYSCNDDGPPPLGAEVETVLSDGQIYTGQFEGISHQFQYTVTFRDSSQVTLKMDQESMYVKGQNLPKRIENLLVENVFEIEPRDDNGDFMLEYDYAEDVGVQSDSSDPSLALVTDASGSSSSGTDSSGSSPKLLDDTDD